MEMEKLQKEVQVSFALFDYWNPIEFAALLPHYQIS